MKDIRKVTAGRLEAKNKCLSKNVITEFLTIVCYLTAECKIADKRQLRKEKYSASSLALDLEHFRRSTTMWRRRILLLSGLCAQINSQGLNQMSVHD